MGSISSSGCGISLAQGTIAAGGLSIVRSVSMLVIGSILLSLSDEQQPEEIIDYAGEDVLYSLRTASHAVRLLGWGFIIDGVCILCVTIGLFVAVKTHRECYLLPWLAVHTMSAITAVPCIAFRAVLGNYRSISVLMLKLMYAVMMVYLCIIVLSYFRMLRFNKTGRVLCQPDQISYVPPSAAAPSSGLAAASDLKYAPHAYTHLPPQSQPASNLPVNPPAYVPAPLNPSYPPPAYSEAV